MGNPGTPVRAADSGSGVPGRALRFNLCLLSGSEGSGESEMDQLSEDGAVEADSEDNVDSCEEEKEDAEPSAGTNSGWADAMAKILNKKTPSSKPTILTKNKELEKEKEKLKQERLEKRKQVCLSACLSWPWSLCQQHSALRASYVGVSGLAGLSQEHSLVLTIEQA